MKSKEFTKDTRHLTNRYCQNKLFSIPKFVVAVAWLCVAGCDRNTARGAKIAEKMNATVKENRKDKNPAY
jgi:hypothetical protein